jgi:hypothetical protein
MKSIGKSKITKLSPKKNITYPLIRLPQSYTDLIGETAYIFKTEYNGNTLFVLSLDKDFDGELQVIQPSSNSDLGSRLKSVEKQLSLLQESISVEKMNCGGPDEIRTHDPRRVKAMS